MSGFFAFAAAAAALNIELTRCSGRLDGRTISQIQPEGSDRASSFSHGKSKKKKTYFDGSLFQPASILDAGCGSEVHPTSEIQRLMAPQIRPPSGPSLKSRLVTPILSSLLSRVTRLDRKRTRGRVEYDTWSLGLTS